MKKKSWLFIALALLMLLSGCKRSSFADTLGTNLSNWQESGKANQPRPITIESYQDAKFGDTLGFEVTSLPSEGKMAAEKFFIIDEWYGQIEFTSAAGLSLNIRVALAGNRSLAGTYTESHGMDKQTFDVGGIEVTTGESLQGCALARWTRGDLQYTLHSNKVQGMPPREDIETMVQGLDGALLADLSSSDASQASGAP